MSDINLDDYRKLADVEDFHFGQVTIMKAVRQDSQFLLWKREENLSPKKLKLYQPQLVQRKAIHHENLLSLVDFKIDEASRAIDVFFEYSPLNSSALKLADIDMAFKWLLDTLSGLSYLNSLGFVHGDIRPEFIVYFPNQKAFKIVDKFANFVHPSTALKNYIRSDKDLYASPRFFSEVFNKKPKDIKFNFYKNESFSVGLVLLKMLYGPAVKLRAFYNKKFKMFNTYNFLDAMKSLEERISEPKELQLLEFLRTKLLCYSESDRLNPAKTLEEFRALIREVYKIQDFQHLQWDTSQILLKKAHEDLLPYYPSIKVFTEAARDHSRPLEKPISEILEPGEQSDCHFSQGKSEESLGDKLKNLRADIGGVDYTKEHAKFTKARSFPVRKTVESTAQKRETSSQDILETKKGEHKIGADDLNKDNKISSRKESDLGVPSRVITDLRYQKKDTWLNKNTYTPDLPVKHEEHRHMLELRPYPLSVPTVRDAGASRMVGGTQVPFEHRTLLIKKSDWKPYAEFKTVESIDSSRLVTNAPPPLNPSQLAKYDPYAPQRPSALLPTASTRLPEQLSLPSAPLPGYEIYINFTVLVPEEKVILAKRVVPSLSISSTEHFGLSIDRNMLKVKFKERSEVREEAFSLDEISKKGLNLHVTSNGSRFDMRQTQESFPVNKSSLQNIIERDQEFMNSNQPLITQRAVADRGRLSSVPPEYLSAPSQQGYTRWPESEPQWTQALPNFSQLHPLITTPDSVYQPQLSSERPNIQHPALLSRFSYSNLPRLNSGLIHTPLAYNRSVERFMAPNSRFVNVIHPQANELQTAVFHLPAKDQLFPAPFATVAPVRSVALEQKYQPLLGHSSSIGHYGNK